MKKYFLRVSNFPLLVEWLENEPEDWPPDADIRGVQKSSYTFKDLDGYFDQAVGKGKKKGTASKVVDKNDGGKKSKKKISDDGNKKGKKQVG